MDSETCDHSFTASSSLDSMPMPQTAANTTMSLLTPSESLAFQSFLSSVDYDAFISTQEWAMYTAGEIRKDDDVLSIPHVQGKEALVKATKDLMSLDADRWSHPPQHQLRRQSEPSQFNPPHHVQLPSPQSEVFPFLRQPSRSQPHLQFPQSHPPSSIAPLHTVGLPTTSPYPSPPADNHAPPLSAPPSFPGSALPSPHSQLHSSYQNPKRPISHEPHSANKRQRSSPGSSSSTASTSTLKPPQPGVKPSLLSPSQKKANHIQSEQKRRANIRRGYEALCDTVPALREAILLEEQEEEQNRKEGRPGSGSGNGRGKKKGRRSAAEDIEKVDGRAGPRSENVVLQKTIDYITDLLAERTALLTRLHALPQHLQHLPSEGERLWEREWTGGAEVEEDAEDDGEE